MIPLCRRWQALQMLPFILILLQLLRFSSVVEAFLPPDSPIGCPKEALIDLSRAVSIPSSSGWLIGLDGLRYPPEAQLLLNDGRRMGCPCLAGRECLSLCCSLTRGCLGRIEGPSAKGFPPIYEVIKSDDKRNRYENKKESEVKVNASARVDDFWQFAWDPCNGGQQYMLEPEVTPDDAYLMLSDGNLLQPKLNYTRNFTNFCWDLMNGTFRVLLCFDEPFPNSDSVTGNGRIYDGPAKVSIAAMVVSIPFLVATLIVYALIPELRNIHGLTLTAYVLCLIVAYASLAALQIVKQDSISDRTCIISAYIVHFSFLASFFWLNVMCFDIWWTFGGFRSLHGSVKQRERKKFIMYSIYAWGCASILTGTCMIMDLMPGIPKNFIRPEFGVDSCWFHTAWARALYFYIPMGLTIICNICLFILTAFKISMHKKDTARQLKGSDSRRHDDNKQWFNLYLKLFIVMGINWSMEIISWLVKDKRFKYIWFITDLTNTLQGVIIFIIFVWKDKIKRLLMKRFGCENGILSRNSVSKNGLTTNVTSSAVSKTTCVTSAGAPLHEKVNPFTDPFRPGGKSNANANATTTTNTTLCISENTNGDVKDGVV